MKSSEKQIGTPTQIFDSSEQAIYLYLDDSRKVCNEKFAEMQGYNSLEEWSKVENPLEVGIDKMSQDAVVSAYRDAMEKTGRFKDRC